MKAVSKVKIDESKIVFPLLYKLLSLSGKLRITL
jgi:hypothetical protein